MLTRKSDARTQASSYRAGYLIIGHTTESAVTIWLSGFPGRFRSAVVLVRDVNKVVIDEGNCELSDDIDNVGLHIVDGLQKDTAYFVEVILQTDDDVATPHLLSGRFRTFGARDFEFILGSCHIPLGTLADLVGMGGSVVGAYTNARLLSSPVDRYTRDRASRSLGSRSGATRWFYRLVQNAVMPLTDPTRPESTRGAHGRFSKLIAHLSTTVALFKSQGRFNSRFVSKRQSSRPISRLGSAHDDDGSGLLGTNLTTSPFFALNERCLNDSESHSSTVNLQTPLFMIHAGDQIYGDDEAVRFLSSMTQYMILDDHDVWDQFGHIDPGSSPLTIKTDDPGATRAGALDAYTRYVHSRNAGTFQNPDQLYYAFDQGSAGFFVLDVRTERQPKRPHTTMISSEQRDKLFAWLQIETHVVKFIVSSVPFVAEFKDKKPDSSGFDVHNDKWAGSPYRAKRAEIIEYIAKHVSIPVVFLTGDVHCCYQARLEARYQPPGLAENTTTIYELSAGPIYQYQYGKRADFCDTYSGDTLINFPRADQGFGVSYRSSLDSFFSNANAVMVLRLHKVLTAWILDWHIVTTSVNASIDHDRRVLKNLKRVHNLDIASSSALAGRVNLSIRVTP